MKRSNLTTALLVALLGLAACWGEAAAQTPWNRDLQTLAVLPDPAGGYTVQAVWTADVEATSTPLDLSTEVALRVNGTEIASSSFVLQVDAGSGFGCESGPPCTGSCGSGTLDGEALTLFCYEDGECTVTFCDCDCGTWIVADFGPQPVTPGDEIMVILRPAPGALPDTDTADDQLMTTFHDRAIGWNRGIEAVSLLSTPTGAYDIQVAGSVGWESPTTYLNLDMTVELQVNGVPLSSQNVPAAVDGILDQTCWENGCGSTCGNVNGVPRTCDPYLWWDCACVGGWITIFPGVSLSPSDEIMVLLRPAPGALPELPGTNEDDRDTTRCCPTSDVESMAPPREPWSLEQNHPNPFNPLTAIAFELAEGGPVRVDVLGVDGRLVRTLLDRTLGPGRWSVTWEGRTTDGRTAPSGTYFYRLATAGGTETRKMTLLK
jgi:hypothetical protein